jgi:hypothetical protein
MSKEAAAHFVAAVKATKAEYASEIGHYHKQFILAKKTPTADDVRNLGKIVKEMDEIASAYQILVRGAIQTFGGPSDTTISNAKTLLKTLTEESKKQ